MFQPHYHKGTEIITVKINNVIIYKRYRQFINNLNQNQQSKHVIYMNIYYIKIKMFRICHAQRNMTHAISF